jgi:hypothetical protein
MAAKKTKVDVTVDISLLTLGDVEDLMLREEDMTLPEQIDLLDKIVTSEGGARAIPITEVNSVMLRVQEEINGIVNPTSDNGADPEKS